MVRRYHIIFCYESKCKKLIAYEPITSSYQEAKSLIAKSPLKHKIKLVNKAIDDINPLFAKYGGVENKVGNGITLNAALRGFKNVAIKCDVEGAEGTLFENSNLDNVYALEVEYHNAYYPNCRNVVTQTLKMKGFETFLKPHSDHPEKLAVHGYINAWRKDFI